MKKIFSLMLTLAIAVSMFVLPASATTTVTTKAELEAALLTGGNIVLGANIDMGEYTLYVAKDTTVVLDLNGYKITGEQSTKITKNDSLINNKGTLTIKSSVDGGEIVYNYTGETTNYAYSASTIDNEQAVLNVVSGKITSLSIVSQQIKYAINNLTNGGNGDSTVNISGGTIYAAAGASVRGFANSTTCTNTINITGGDFTAYVQMQDSNANANKGVINISNGTFSSVDPSNPDYYAVYLYGNTDASNLNVNISGGTYNGTVYLTQVNTADETKVFNADISNGTFNGEVWSCTWGSVEKDVPVITGGTFTSDVELTVEDGYCLGTNNTVGVHNVYAVDGTAKSCTTNGTAAHYTCDNCKVLYSDNGVTETTADALVISATDHAWGEWNKTTEATCEAKGEETRVCANNSTHIETREIAANGHVWSSETKFDAAAHWNYCYVCGVQGEFVGHSDADNNGYCVCGWPIAGTSGRANPKTGVTAEMLG